ncbi:MAG: enoyl-CoA hydratase/isomerase family protein [bacterium]|jgi:methylglutaconyl-CoA hydratase|nr:enoyl-CoA hydratase/isomerase family protein [bacterium]
MTTLTLHTDDQVALVTLNRPQVRNAIDERMVRELRGLVDELERDDGLRAVVLTGAGKAFCSGMDLDYLARTAQAPAVELRRDTEHLRELFVAIRSSRLPWIAAVNGPAVAGGAGLATVCDLVLADRGHARFGYPEVQIGFIPALVAVLLVARVGETAARDLLLTGRLVKPDAAQRLGLVNELAEEGQVLALAGQRARALARGCAPGAVAATKSLLERLRGRDTASAMDIAVEANIRQRTDEECHRGVRAFLDKEELDWRRRGGESA